MTIESRLGEGAAFTVTFPAAAIVRDEPGLSEKA